MHLTGQYATAYWYVCIYAGWCRCAQAGTQCWCSSACALTFDGDFDNMSSTTTIKRIGMPNPERDGVKVHISLTIMPGMPHNRYKRESRGTAASAVQTSAFRLLVRLVWVPPWFAPLASAWGPAPLCSWLATVHPVGGPHRQIVDNKMSQGRHKRKLAVVNDRVIDVYAVNSSFYVITHRLQHSPSSNSAAGWPRHPTRLTTSIR